MSDRAAKWTTLILILLVNFTTLGLLMVSTWFIAASATFGTTLNYMLPAVIIRALALTRIASGYGEKIIGHQYLFSKLSTFRVLLIKQMFSSLTQNYAPTNNHAPTNNNILKQNADIRQLTSSEKLDEVNHHAQQAAAIWVYGHSQLISLVATLTVLNALCLMLLPSFLIATVSITLIFTMLFCALLVSSRRTAKQRRELENDVQLDFEHFHRSAPLWHLYQTMPKVSIETLNDLDRINESQSQKANSLLQVAGMGVLAVMVIGGNLQVHQPIDILLLTLLFLVAEWLGAYLKLPAQLTNMQVSQDRIKELIKSASIGQIEINQATRLPMSPSSNYSLKNYPSKNYPSKIYPSNNFFSDRFSSSEVNSIDLNKYEARHSQFPPLTVSFKAHGNHIILGSSGIGKTSLLKALIGLNEATGSLQINNVSSIDSLQPQAIYVSSSELELYSTLRESLTLGKSFSDEEIYQVLEAVNLTSLNQLDEFLGEGSRRLSGGELKRLSIARALLHNRTFLLLDEPFEGLDQNNIHNLCKLFNQLKNTHTLFIATHILPEALEVSSCLDLEALRFEHSPEARLSEFEHTYIFKHIHDEATASFGTLISRSNKLPMDKELPNTNSAPSIL